jgi:hypothetical protein
MPRNGKIFVRANNSPLEGGQGGVGAARTFALAAIMFCAVCATAHAQDSTKSARQQPAVATESDTLPAPIIDENAASSRLFLDKVEVLGTVAKPQALFIIPGRDPQVDGIEIDRSFFREIFRPYEKDYHPANTRRYLKEQAVW